MTKRTPGPWEHRRTTPPQGWDGWEIYGDDGAKVVCAVYGPQRDRVTEADAHLIAAAPDLLAALKLQIAHEAMPADRGGKDGPKGRAWQNFIEARDAAIAKAEGRA